MNQQRDGQSLGGEKTFLGGKPSSSIDRSLGEQSTFGGAQNSSFTPLESGSLLGDEDIETVDLSKRYRIEGVIGQGGMGQVSLAFDTRLDRKVAIKRILGEASRSKSALQRFLIEAKSIAALSHPNVVQVYDYGRDAMGPYLILEYVDGASLLDRCRNGPLPLDQTIDLACQICDGLAKAHDAGIIHRDIKPANILITKDGHPKISDFGLAKSETTVGGMTMAGAVLGTLDFMPPEQKSDTAVVDARSDLWSLAATVYQMVTGESPRVINLDAVPRGLRSVLSQALKTKKEERFQTAREFKNALRSGTEATNQKPGSIITDLGAGECPACHTMNEAHRKFCRECAESLRCGCLKCQHEIPVWDKVCPECGGKQAHIAATLVAELSQKRERAEQLRSEFGFEAAIALANEVAQFNDRRTSVHRDWAIEFLEVTGQEQTRQLESARLHFEEAKKHRAAFDYAAAIQAMRAIPASLLSPEQSEFLTQLESEQREASVLLDTIKVRIQNRELGELLPLVERALNLRGDRADLAKLAGQLIELERKQRRDQDDAFRHAENLLYEGNASEALRTVKQIRVKSLTPTQHNLYTKLERIDAVEAELKEMIQQVKADGVIDASHIVSLLPMATYYTELNPNNRRFLKLRDDLLTRARTMPIELLRELPKECLQQLASEVQDHGLATLDSLTDAPTNAGNSTEGSSDLRLQVAKDNDSEIVDLWKRYRFESVIGQGGMGQVLLATDTRLDRKVAIKRILGEASRSKTALQRFLTEAKSIAALSHPNVVQVYDYGRDATGPYLIMEYVDGASLLDRCREGAMPLEEAIDLACQICDGLTKAHKAGIVHRDIKPANILITKDGYPKLTDFGLAKQESADHGQTVSDAILGTLEYMPPEQRRDSSKVDARSDLWSLAATLYVMLTGRSPRVIRVNQVPESLRAVMAQALEENPEERFSSAQEFKEALLKAKGALATNVGVGKKLETGECPKCGAHNELSNKFCTSCTASLQQPCLNCGHMIRAWNAICPECGSRQSEALLSRQKILDQ